jgi:polysaccharide biosynthesis/export protein
MQFKASIIGALLIAVWGCAIGPRPQATLEQMASQVESQAKQNNLQKQLLSQMSRAALTAYRDYQIGPEDLLEVSFFGLDELRREVRVNGRGEITLPLVGQVQVAGMSPQQVEDKLMQLYKEGEYINNPQISVLVKEYRHQQVMVSGAVDEPGSYEVVGPRTLLEMLGKAGGLNDKAGDVVQVVRHQSAADRTKRERTTTGGSLTPETPEAIVIDLRRLLVQGELDLNIPIQSGDVIHVPFARNAFVLGAVNSPGGVPIKDNLTVTQALAVAGGLNPLLASNLVTIVRFDEHGEQTSFSMNMTDTLAGKKQDPLVKENDIVFAHESGLRRILFNIKQLMPFSLRPF